MPKYEVQLILSGGKAVEVEAASEEDAIEKVLSEYSPGLCYSCSNDVGDVDLVEIEANIIE